MDDNFQKLLFRELSRLLRPLTQAAVDSSAALELFDRLGWDLEAVAGLDVSAVTQMLADFSVAYQAIEQLSTQPLESLDQFSQALTAVPKALKHIHDLPTLLPSGTRPDGFDQVGQDLIEHLVVTYLQDYHPVLWQTAALLTLAERGDEFNALVPAVVAADKTLLRRAHRRPRVRLDNLGGLLSDPIGLLKKEYADKGLAKSSDAQVTARKLFGRLQALLYVLGAESLLGLDPVEGYDLGAAGDVLAAGMFTFAFQTGLIPQDGVFGATLALSPGDEAGLGLVVSPFGRMDLERYSARWLMELNATADLPAFAVNKQGLIVPPGVSSDFDLLLKLARLSDPDDPAVRLGSRTGTRLEIGMISASGEVHLNATSQEYGFLFEAGKAAFVIAAGDGDGFIQKVLSAFLEEGLRVDFDLAMGWSNRKGLYFRGSAGLEATLPVNRTLFEALTIDSIYLAIKVSNKKNERPLRMIVAVTAHLKLGPVAAVVERMGLRADFDFPTSGGNLGPVDLALGFKPPDGAGISISTSIVSGGGYLSFNADAQQYAGAVYLELAGKFSLTALGLITTRMPDGKPGFSMLIIIAVEFSPGIQLGYGFMLTGVGGLLGINRTVNTEVLRSGIRTGMLNSVLFPKKVIENAPQIFSNLSAAFPPLEGHFIVGPAVKIAWGGAVTIIAIELGIALEFAPAPQRLLIMGRLIASLPDANNPIVHLQMDSLGIIDFVEGTISLDAVLYDSRIRELTISGGMALRVGWSKNAAFLLSVGGYHPDFRPPANFPVVDRLAIGLARGDNFRLRLESYFALTANTVQTGARLEIYAEAGGFSLAGFLGFDVLVHFNPFQFQAAIQAGVVLKRGNQVLMSITLEVTLTGPEPWLIDGRASFSILGFSHSIPIHQQIGDAKPEPPMEAVDVKARLLEALRDEHNWSSSLPAGDHPLVALAETTEGLRAEPETAKGKVWAHPGGNLALRQRVVPLNQPIAKFGEAPVESTEALAIALDFGAGAEGLTVEVEKDQFAPAQFKEMSDAEKLSSPSFVLWDAGLRLALESVLISAHKDSSIDEYEMRIITRGGDIVDAPAPAVLSPPDLDMLLPFGAVAQAPIRNTGRAMFAAPVLAEKSGRRPA